MSRNQEAAQQQGLSGLLGLAEDVKAYLQLLSSFLDQQNRFVKDQKLTREKVALATASPLCPSFLWQQSMLWILQLVTQRHRSICGILKFGF